MLSSAGSSIRSTATRVRWHLRQLRPDRDHLTINWLTPPYDGPRTVERIFFINLESSVDRRALVERAMAETNVPSERFPAIHGATEREQYRAYLEARPRRELPSDRDEVSSVAGGTLGCWLSHVQLLRHISTLDDGLYLVVEDDYELPPDWAATLDTLIAEIRDDWDVLKLFSVGLLGKAPLRGVRVTEHLVRLGPALLTAQNLSSAAYLVRHRKPRIEQLIRAVEELPLIHYDGALNLVMDEFRFYAPRKQFGSLSPLSATSTR